MGLFSFLSKNKQDSSADVSGRFSRPDDEFSERARAKRASHAGGGARRGPDDPMLPEKKRARRRLVGAVALALAAAIGLPMLLDSEPKPLAGDVDIQIPAKDKAGPLPMPAAPASAPEAASAPVAAPVSVAASQSVDKGEEVIAAPPAAPAAPSATESARKVVAVQAAPEKVEAPKPVAADHKSELAHLDAPKPEHKPKPEQPKPAPPKKEDKPAHVEDAARAMAILEGKESRPHEASDKVVLQVAALGTPEKVAELQAKLRDAGIRSFTEKYQNLIRVKVGPYSRDEAEKVRAQLSKLGLSGKLQPA